MLRNQKSEARGHPSFALLCLSWLLEDRLAVSPRLHEKLAVPPRNLIVALASLTPPERQELKSNILNTATHGSLPGPLRAKELCDFLDSIPAASPQSENSATEA
jgi:hypothetical protein